MQRDKKINCRLFSSVLWQKQDEKDPYWDNKSLGSRKRDLKIKTKFMSHIIAITPSCRNVLITKRKKINCQWFICIMTITVVQWQIQLLHSPTTLNLGGGGGCERAHNQHARDEKHRSSWFSSPAKASSSIPLLAPHFRNTVRNDYWKDTWSLWGGTLQQDYWQKLLHSSYCKQNKHIFTNWKMRCCRP